MRKPVSPEVLVTQKFGKTAFNPNHNGVDFSGRFNKTVYAPEAGTLSYQWQPTLGGNVLALKGKTGEHRLAHLSSMVKKSGSVKEGQVLGVMGSTGKATAIHLHWGLLVKGYYVDPLLYIDTPKPKEDNADMPTPKDVDDYFQAFAKRKATSAEKSGYSKKPWRTLIDNLFRSYKARVGKLVASKDKIIAEQQKTIDKLVAEKSQAGKEAIVSDLENKTEPLKAPEVEEPTLWESFLNHFRR